MEALKKIIISRTDNLGDVMLTLPLAGILKKYHPDATIIFLGKKYTRPLIDCSRYVDEFVDWEELKTQSFSGIVSTLKQHKAQAIIHVFPNPVIARASKSAAIPLRIGTSHRWYHWFNCNKRLNLGRRKSPLHEAQLNIQLLKPLVEKTDFTTSEIADFYGFDKLQPLPDKFSNRLSTDKFNLVLHPRSKGSSREWGLNNFQELIRLLPADKFKIFISGTKAEHELMKEFLEENKNKIVDLTGELDLTELISFISKADGLVAASTGPLHIAAALGKHALGIYPPIKPMHPGRSAPIGKNAHYFVLDKECNDCRKTQQCTCIESIEPKTVVHLLENLLKHG